MKSKKWIWVTLTVLLTLIVLAGVAGASFRMGVMQSPAFSGKAAGDDAQLFEHMHSFDGHFDRQFKGDPRLMQEFGHGGFDRSSFGSGRMTFFSPIFGLIKLAVLGALLWLISFLAVACTIRLRLRAR